MPEDKNKTALETVIVDVDGYHYAGVAVAKGKTLTVTPETAALLVKRNIAVRPAAPTAKK